MKTIYLIMTNCNIEFKDSKNEFAGWSEHPTPLYAFKTFEEAKEEIENLRKNETIEYRKWLFKKSYSACFIHHQFSVQEIMVFDKTLPY